MAIPPHAVCVFRGEIFEVWQWQQVMFDGQTQTFERLRRPDSVQIIPVVSGQILIEEQLQPDWSKPLISLPGGRCEPDESPLASAQRELREETGYVSSDWQLWQSIQPGGKIDWQIHTFLARQASRSVAATPDFGEQISCRLISFEEFLRLPDQPNFRDRNLTELLLRARFQADVRQRFAQALFGNAE